MICRNLSCISHADPASLITVAALAERIHSARQNGTLEVYLFGPAERMMAEPEQAEFNSQSDALVKTSVQVTADLDPRRLGNRLL